MTIWQAKIPGFDKSLRLDFKGAFDDKPLTLKGTVGPIWAWVEPGYPLPADLTVGAGGATAQVKGELGDPTNLKNITLAYYRRRPIDCKNHKTGWSEWMYLN